MESLSLKAARRLALARAGLLRAEFTGLPARAGGKGKRARDGCYQVVDRFGYLQLDTISVAGARTQGIVLASRLEGLDASVAETLLQPGAPYFEYWGHEACWLPMDLYPAFEFRRIQFRSHPWWGDLLGEHRAQADALLARIEAEGPLRSMDLEAPPGHKSNSGSSTGGWWDTKLSKRIAEALWSAGELAIRERRNFQRNYDLTERVIPRELTEHPLSTEESLDRLLLKALDGHGWATTGTLSATWRLRNRREAIVASLERLVESGEVIPCELATGKNRQAGWVRPAHLEDAGALERARLHANRPVLLSPFDPVLWDRDRVRLLFGFDQVLEIYKPEDQRQYGYYCLPVLAGEWLIGRVDLKADRKAGTLAVRACHLEPPSRGKDTADFEALVTGSVDRYAQSVGLDPEPL